MIGVRTFWRGNAHRPLTPSDDRGALETGRAPASRSESSSFLAKPAQVPIIVGITGKRKAGIASSGVSDKLIFEKLRHAFALIDCMAPSSPKLLICGMADGVDEIAAELVIE